MVLILCTPRLAGYVWKSVQKYIQSALDAGRGEMTAADVFSSVKRGNYKLWFIPGVGAGVTEFAEYPSYRSLICRLWAAERPLEEYMHLFSHVLAWGKGQGCSAIEVFGRKGWERKLPGFEHSISILRTWL